MAWLLNLYKCDRCRRRWTDEWSCMCDHECPHCGRRDMTPFKSEDLTTLVEEEAGRFVVTLPQRSPLRGREVDRVVVAAPQRLQLAPVLIGGDALPGDRGGGAAGRRSAAAGRRPAAQFSAPLGGVGARRRAGPARRRSLRDEQGRDGTYLVAVRRVAVARVCVSDGGAGLAGRAGRTRAAPEPSAAHGVVSRHGSGSSVQMTFPSDV